jgi:hypothetical protein
MMVLLFLMVLILYPGTKNISPGKRRSVGADLTGRKLGA